MGKKALNYIRLLRPKHWIKNMLIFIPIFFSRQLFTLQYERLLSALFGFVSFSFFASAVYIFNDLKDIEKDRNHPSKKNRPLASGALSKKDAVVLWILCIGAAVSINLALHQYLGLLIALLYFLLNIAYSAGLKNLPLVDIIILAFGYILRIIYGAVIIKVEVSGWLYLTVFAGAFYMGLGKRRNELKTLEHKDTRKSLKYYNYSFLDKNMYVCLALVDVFYALWALEQNSPLMIWSVLIVMIILMKYSLDVEGTSDGDPIEVVLHDKMILLAGILYIIYITIVIYML